MVESRVAVISSVFAPPRRLRFASISARSFGPIVTSAMRMRNESGPPDSAQRGSREAPTLVPEAVYGYCDALPHGLQLGRRRLSVERPDHGTANGALTDVDGGIGADAVLRPATKLGADVDGSTAVVVGDDGGDALHQVGQVRLALRVGEV